MPDKRFTKAQQAAFFEAAAQGDLSTLKSLVEAGMEVDLPNSHYWNCTALMQAAYHGRIEVVRYLLEQGAAVQQTDGMNWPPLTHAAWGGHVEIVKLLLAWGADVNFSSPLEDRGVPWGTALQIAGHNVEIAQVLRQAGARE